MLDHILAADVPVSRTELVELTGLTRPTITRIVDELISGRLVAEAGLTFREGGAGRPRMGLTLSRRGPAGLGLDIRSDGLGACVVDFTGNVRYTAFELARHADRDAFAMVAQVARMAAAAVDAVAAEDLKVVNATLAVPGPVQAGVVRSAPALGWRDVDAATMLRGPAGHLDLSVAVENEAKLAALGELYASNNKLSNFLYVSGGLGIGAGLVLDGQLIRGAHGWSGELGHVNVFPDGKPCRCGARGCLEAYAGLEAMLVGEPAPAGMSRAAAVVARAEAEQPETLAILDSAGFELGVALSDTLNILDIDTVLLGGSFSLLSAWLSQAITAEIGQRVLTTAWSPITVRPALLGPDAAAVGGALTAIDEIRRHPADWLECPHPATASRPASMS
ncbi:MAG TPA: ROK family transcriptional regulator [Actinoplanes sp.]